MASDEEEEKRRGRMLYARVVFTALIRGDVCRLKTTRIKREHGNTETIIVTHTSH